MKLRNMIAQWILVRTFGYATDLLHRLDDYDARRPTHRQHVELLRHVCSGLYRQIRCLSDPTFTLTQTSTNQWP